ncbi:MAG: DUF6069 family protein [Chitinivibrionales bacterium]
MEERKRKTPEQRAGLGKYMIGAALASIVAVVLNNLYHIVYTAATGIEGPQTINAVSISIVTVVAILFGGLVYFVLSRMTRYATVLFVIGGLLAAAATTSASFMPFTPPAKALYPAQYVLLAAPMHFIAGLCCVWIIPSIVRLRKKRWRSELHG